MGKKWDYDVPSIEIWSECLRVLKPGGHLLSFAGTRTQHRMCCNIEDAGFEIRDMIAWIYGSGFPKSLNIGKAIDKMQGNERIEYKQPIAYPDSECWSIPNKNSKGNDIGFETQGTGNRKDMDGKGCQIKTKGFTQYEGWGTSLKPALEPITVARKPLSEKNIAQNVLKWGTGGINIDACRVGTEKTKTTIKDLSQAHGNKFGKSGIKYPTQGYKENPPGRFPSNIIHDGDQLVMDLFPESKSGAINPTHNSRGWASANHEGYQRPCMKDYKNIGWNIPASQGSAARFFYCAKASKSERNSGGVKNIHATVKPLKLMRYLCRLVTPPEGTVLDPFMGSGSTGIAALQEGFDFIGIEREKEYIDIAQARINTFL